ncbi:MAG: hypothetical protein J6C86_02700 [Bacteroidaceae bacterium]|nr:hypothetical protein [Bacteroidaceae bacterium]
MKHSTKSAMKVLALLLAVFALSISAKADNVLRIEDFSVVPGEEKTVSVILDNSDPISSLQFDVQLPEGIEFVEKSAKMNKTRLKNHSLLTNKVDGLRRFAIFTEAEDIKESAFAGNSGEIFTFNVKATTEFKGGTMYVSEIVGSDATVAIPVEHDMNPFSVKVFPFAGTFSLSAEAVSMVVDAPEPIRVDISIANNTALAGLQLYIDLPENLVVESIGTGERVPDNYKPKPAQLDASGTVVLSSLMVEDFEGEDGTVLTLNLKAVGIVRGQLTVKNLITSNTSGTTFRFEGEKSVEVVALPAMAELADGDYLVKNVATDKFLGGANSWGTQASLVDNARIFTVTKAENGKYILDSHTYNAAEKHFVGSNGFVDADASEFYLFGTSDAATISVDENNSLGAPAEGTALDVDLTYDDANAVWQFISVADAVAAVESGDMTDATFLLKDASISRNLYNPEFEAVWEGDAFTKGGDQHVNFCAEKWGGNSQEFDVYQTIDIPNGTYLISLDGFYRYNNTTDNTNDVAVKAHADGTEAIYSYLYANHAKVPLASIADDEASATLENLPFSMTEASDAFAQGLYKNTLKVVVVDGKLTVGVKKTKHIGTDWTIWDNFTITKVEDAPYYAEIYDVSLIVADGQVIEEDGTFKMSIGCKTMVAPEDVASKAFGTVTYIVTPEGGEDVEGTADFDLANEANVISIPGLAYSTSYTVAVKSVSVSYKDAETEDPVLINEVSVEDVAVSFTTNAEPIVGTISDIALSVADGQEIEDGMFKVVFSCKTVVTPENIASVAYGTLVYTVASEGGDAMEFTTDFSLADEAVELLIPNLAYNTHYTVAVKSVSVSYKDAETEEPVLINEVSVEDIAVSFTTTIDAINGIHAETMKDGKYIENGKVVIIKNGAKFNIAGYRMK